MNLRTALRLCAAAALMSGVAVSAQRLPSAPLKQFGASVTPSFDGWFFNPDGTQTFLVGYFNRNIESEVDIPIGPNNRFEPGEPDLTLVDEAGRLYHTEERTVSVDVEGPGTLQGLGSAIPRTEETFGEPTHDTFNGRVLAVVRPTGPGTITVTVATDGLVSQHVTIEAR